MKQHHGTLVPGDRLVLLGPQLLFVAFRRRREEAIKGPEVLIALDDVDLPVVASVDGERLEVLIEKSKNATRQRPTKMQRANTYLMKSFHCSLLFFLTLDGSSNMFHINLNKILPRLPTNEEVAFFDRDEDDDDVEGGKIKPRTGVEGRDGFGHGVLVLGSVSRGVGEDSPERHLVWSRVYKGSLTL
jgi:hypothetical protein